MTKELRYVGLIPDYLRPGSSHAIDQILFPDPFLTHVLDRYRNGPVGCFARYR